MVFAALEDLLPTRLSDKTLFHGFDILTLALLVLLLAATLPRADRKYLRAPLLLMISFLAVMWLRSAFPREIAESAANNELDPLGCVALFLFLVAIIRCAFLLVARSVLTRLGSPFSKIMLDLVQVALYVGAMLIVLSRAGVATGELLTGSALITAAIGFALKDTLGNMFSGLAIQMQRPFEVGDWIEFDDKLYHIGKVTEINWRATKVITLDEVEVILPNGTLGQAHIRNFTKPEPWSRRSIYFHAPYDVSPQKVQRVVLEAIVNAWGVLEYPPPSVVTFDFDERGVQYWVRIFTKEFDKRDRVDGSVRDHIWYALNRHGIHFPLPGRRIRMIEDSPETLAREEEQQIGRRMLALRGVDIFSSLDEESLRRLASLSRTLLFAAGEAIINQGEEGHEMFIILRGKVAVTVHRQGLKTLLVSRLGPGKFFGEMSLMTGAVRSATITTNEECELLAVGKAAFAQILSAHPDLAEQISRILAGRQAELGERVAGQASEAQATMERSNDLLSRIKDFFSLS